ncbi:phytoene/squalene synthase family protein [Allostreptomyces psammosilenae]|uniref:phytoene/squalene synthase family protein n=1 Tax=Allostreptomyces psammosilenae TaxID=1892865 RepID=UPI0035E41C8C
MQLPGGHDDTARRLPPPGPEAAAAYTYCEAVTRSQARNFSYGIALLSGDRRRAMSAIYAFARRIDDIGDGTAPADRKTDQLTRNRRVLSNIAELRALPATEAVATASDIHRHDPVALALTDTATRFPIPLDALEELIDGVSMDIAGTSYRTWDDLRHYCRCVAGTIGRLSLGVFGSTARGAAEAARASRLADTLGVALQLTNILRDLREDALVGRSYLPSAELERFGCQDGFRAGHPAPGSDFAGLVKFQAHRARELFEEGFQLLPMLDRRSAACVSAMAGIYRRLLTRIAADPGAVLRGRVALPGREKALVAATGLLGVRP